MAARGVRAEETAFLLDWCGDSVVRPEGHCLTPFFFVQSKSLDTQLLLLSLLDRSPARLGLSLIDDSFGSFQRTYGRIKPRHVSSVIFDQRPGPSIAKTLEPQGHLEEDGATPGHRLLILLNHHGGL